MQRRSCDNTPISGTKLHLKAVFVVRMQAGSGITSR